LNPTEKTGKNATRWTRRKRGKEYICGKEGGRRKNQKRAHLARIDPHQGSRTHEGKKKGGAWKSLEKKMLNVDHS